MKQILRHLKGCPGEGLLHRKNRMNNPLEIQGFTDADWAGSPFDRRSTSKSGYYIKLGGNIVV